MIAPHESPYYADLLRRLESLPAMDIPRDDPRLADMVAEWVGNRMVWHNATYGELCVVTDEMWGCFDRDPLCVAGYRVEPIGQNAERGVVFARIVPLEMED